MRHAPPTIRDVAAHAGCSIATVSRVTTGGGPVSEDMRKRVVAAALALGFNITPHRETRRPILCVLLPSVTNPVFAAALAGIEHCARAGGLSTIIGQSNYDVLQEEKVVAALIAERPTGFIMTVCQPHTSTALAAVAQQGLPAVTVYNEPAFAEVGGVSVDNRSAMRRMAEELIVLGHQTILFVGGRFSSSDRSAARYEGYRDAMRAARLNPLPPFEVDFIEATADIDLTLAMSDHMPTAIIASNDLLAVTVMASLRRLGLSVPEDVSVTGFDGIEVGRHISPQLTTIIQPSRTMGVLAATLVLGIANGRRKPEHLRADVVFSHGETIAPPGRRARPNPSHPPHAHGTSQP